MIMLRSIAQGGRRFASRRNFSSLSNSRLIASSPNLRSIFGTVESKKMIAASPNLRSLMLLNKRQLFHYAAADELKQLADDREAALARMSLSSGSDEASLHRNSKLYLVDENGKKLARVYLNTDSSKSSNWWWRFGAGPYERIKSSIEGLFIKVFLCTSAAMCLIDQILLWVRDKIPLAVLEYFPDGWLYPSKNIGWEDYYPDRKSYLLVVIPTTKGNVKLEMPDEAVVENKAISPSSSLSE